MIRIKRVQNKVKVIKNYSGSSSSIITLKEAA